MAAMNLWANYVKERYGWDTIVIESGFITYDLKIPECSIEEFYVEPDQRGGTLAKRLADEVFRIAEKEGCKRVWARIIPGTPGAEQAMRSNLHYGFKLFSSQGNAILLVKTIGGD